MKKQIVLLGCVLLSGVSFAALEASKEAAAEKKAEARIDDRYLFEGMAAKDKKNKVLFGFAQMARTLKQHKEGEWIIFKFFDEVKQHEETKAADNAIFDPEYNENAAEVTKLYRVNLAYADERIMNKYNPRVLDVPLYACCESDGSEGEDGERYIDACLEADDIHFAATPNAVPGAIEKIMEGLPTLPGV
jgi:hypothetical protein